MSSTSRNSRKPLRALGLAAAFSLLLGSAAQAADEPNNFVLTAFSNGKGGAHLVSGNYQAALEELGQGSPSHALDPAAVSNNRCVAFSVTRQWKSARLACNDAVRDALQERASLSTYLIWGRSMHNDYVAVALSNRAVLHWMSADADAAATDLKQAEGLSPKSVLVAHNLTALRASPQSVAQVTVAPRS
jgi:hypothetical protein